jgi:tRNA (guanine-N7-)-methyltransferase
MMLYALANPAERILGIEVRDTWVRWVNGVIDGEGIPNARSVWHTVVNGLEFLEPHTIREAFYLFPDPWPKRRHEKRRAFTSAFLDDLVRVLQPGGVLHLATDVPEVEEYELQVLEEHGAFAIERSLTTEQWGFPFHTDQEKFCLAKGIPYNRFRAVLR